MQKKRLWCGMVMMCGSILHGMEEQNGMYVPTKDGNVHVPQTFIDATPVLKNIQATKELKNLKLRGLFEDQAAIVVRLYMQDHAGHVLEIPVEKQKERLNVYRGVETMYLYIALARRLKDERMEKKYIELVHGSKN